MSQEAIEVIPVQALCRRPLHLRPFQSCCISNDWKPMVHAKKVHGWAQATDRSAGTRNLCPGNFQPFVCWLHTQVRMCQRSHCVLLHVFHNIQGVGLAAMSLPSLVVALRPSDSAQPRLQMCLGAGVSRSTWDHVAGNVSGSQEISFTWIAVILDVTFTLSLTQSLPSCPCVKLECIMLELPASQRRLNLPTRRPRAARQDRCI